MRLALLENLSLGLAVPNAPTIDKVTAPEPLEGDQDGYSAIKYSTLASGPGILCSRNDELLALSIGISPYVVSSLACIWGVPDLEGPFWGYPATRSIVLWVSMESHVSDKRTEARSDS